MNRVNTICRKYTLLFSIFIFSSVAAQNNINVTLIEKLNIVSETGSFHPVLSNYGGFLCYSSNDYKGLYLYSFSTKKSIEISTTTNSCTNVLFSKSDDMLYFSQKDILKKGDILLKSYNLNSNKLTTVEDTKEEEVKTWWDNFISLFSDDVEESSLNIEALKSGYHDFPYVQLEKGKMFLVDESEKQLLNPTGVQYYLNPILSPDSKKISAQAIGKESFVCNTNTSDYMSLGNIEAVEWVSNSLLIGMIPDDNGHEVKNSTIVSYDINSNKYTSILNDSIKGMYPRYSPKVGKIVCHTPDGNIYMITIELK